MVHRTSLQRHSQTVLTIFVLGVGGMQWPFTDPSPLTLAFFAASGSLVVLLGVSRRFRESHLAPSFMAGALAYYGGFQPVTRTGLLARRIAVLVVAFSGVVLLYRSGYAPWETPNGTGDTG